MRLSHVGLMFVNSLSRQAFTVRTDKRKVAAMTRVHTHYDNLKVARDAPPEVIRAAYRSLCHKFHPDHHGGSAKATQTFQLINTAYEVLSDPQRRQQHDAWIARKELDMAPPPWDGRERRRRPWPAAGGRSSDEWSMLLRRPGAATMLWTSAAAIGAMLLMLAQY